MPQAYVRILYKIWRNALSLRPHACVFFVEVSTLRVCSSLGRGVYFVEGE